MLGWLRLCVAYTQAQSVCVVAMVVLKDGFVNA